MFPPAIPHVFVRWLTKEGDLVADPFSGRGTAPLEAALLGRRSFGGDANPLAYVLTGAKLHPPERTEIRERLADLRKRRELWDVATEPDVIRTVFHPRTLGELLWLRGELRLDHHVDRFIMAWLLGALHHNADKDGRPRGLTVSMPNTFAMAPAYVSRYVRAHQLTAPDISPLDFLLERLSSCPLPTTRFRKGEALQSDVLDSARVLADDPATLIFSSPPYLEVIRYGKFNWLRLWLLGHSSKQVDAKLFQSSSLGRYLSFMKAVIASLRSAIRDDGFVCLVIGDVRRDQDDLNLAQAVADSCVPGSGLRVAGLVTDRLPTQKKVSRIWGEHRGRATKVERILILTGPKASLARPLGRIRWG